MKVGLVTGAGAGAGRWSAVGGRRSVILVAVIRRAVIRRAVIRRAVSLVPVIRLALRKVSPRSRTSNSRVETGGYKGIGRLRVKTRRYGAARGTFSLVAGTGGGVELGGSPATLARSQPSGRGSLALCHQI